MPSTSPMGKGRKHVKKTYKSSRKHHAVPDKAFTKKVKTVLSRTLETKTYGANIWSNQAITLMQLATTAPTNYELVNGGFLSTINQGVSDGQRIGDKIHVKSFILSGVMQTLPGNLRPCYIRMVVFKSKLNTTSATQALAMANTSMFEFATGSVAPTNFLQDITRKINPQDWTYVAQRIFKLGQASTVNGNNNDFSMSKFFKVNLSKHVNSVTFDPFNAVSSPRNLFVAFFGAYEDGTAITFGPYTGPLVSVTMDATIKYQDA